MGNFKDYSGQKFGRLTAIRPTGRKTFPSGNAVWIFECDCGNVVERTIPPSSIKMPSCGCYVREHAENLNKTHGGRHERLYLVWMDMRRRCLDESDQSYKDYGGRGIIVCDEWKDYSVFREWAKSTGYDETARSHKCTIDRIDVNGNYEPRNCRWVDSKTQNNNRRNNKLVCYKGQTKTLKQWSEELGFNYELACKRLNNGWTTERAFFEPSAALKWKNVHRETC